MGPGWHRHIALDGKVYMTLRIIYLFLKAPSDANGGLHMSISYASKMAHKMATSVLGSLVITSDFPLFKSLLAT